MKLFTFLFRDEDGRWAACDVLAEDKEAAEKKFRSNFGNKEYEIVEH